MRSLIEPVPVKPLSPLGSGRFDPPEGSVFVQTGAYDQYAPGPADDGVNFEPRHGTYLVRMVAYEAINCVGCRGWLVVGRLDTTPAPVATASVAPGTDVTVRSAAELAALLAADRASLIDRPVFVDGRVVPGLAPTCTPAAATCDLGTLEGTDERVTASGYTSTLLLPDADFPTNGVMALVVRTNGLEYLGWMDRGGLVASFANLLDSGQPRGPLTYIVSGWLIDTPGAYACPAQVYVPPPDTPFQTCPWAWLTRDRVQPVTVNPDGGSSMAPPPNAIRVQPTAYSEFAPDPQPEPGGGANQPRFGTYLVRLVTNTSSTDALPERGWQVVARLSP